MLARRIAGGICCFWGARPALLPLDKGAMLARRALDRMIRNKQEVIEA